MKNFLIALLLFFALFSCAPFTFSDANAQQQNSIPEIVVVNDSTLLPQGEAQKIVSAVQTQIARDFAPVYKQTARVTLAEKGAAISDAAWRLYLFDDAPGVLLGFHTTSATGVPQARVYVNKAVRDNQPVSVVVSHEVLEMLANPYVNKTYLVEDGDDVTAFMYEVSDAVQNAKCGYDIGGVKVSDFVYPAWFDRYSAQNQKKFSHNDCVTRPLEIANRGYMPVMRLKRARPAVGGWENKF